MAATDIHTGLGHIGDITQQQVSLIFSPFPRPAAGARAALNCVRDNSMASGLES